MEGFYGVLFAVLSAVCLVLEWVPKGHSHLLTHHQQLVCLVLEWVPKGSLADLLEDATLDLTWADPLHRVHH
jgi:hypothetical protein